MKNEILDFMPRDITAENGAKALVIGEFFEMVEVPNPDYCGCNNCDFCDNHPDAEPTVKTCIPIRWTTIKQIYARLVDHYENQKNAKNGTNEN